MTPPQIIAATLAALIVGAALGLLLPRLFRRGRAAETTQPERPESAELGLLTGGLAHEIKNPLSTLQLNLQLLREDLEAQADRGDPAERGAFGRMIRRVGSVHAEAGRLREILDDFLRYAGRLELDPRPLDLAASLEELVDFLAPQAQARRVRMETLVEGTLPPVRADARLVKQAAMNLLLNAVQHAPEGGTVTLRLAPAIQPARRPGRNRTTRRPRLTGVRVSVSDTGPGVAPEQREHIFEPYYTRRKGGTGLGLALTRRIVEAHGGRLELDNQAGRGATFTFDLPLAATPRPADARRRDAADLPDDAALAGVGDAAL